MNAVAFLIGTTAMGLAAGCLPIDDVTRVDFNRTAWDAVKPHEYVFEYVRDCLCPGRGAWWRVRIRGDSVIHVELADTGAAQRDDILEGLEMHHPTIDEIFAQISHDLRRKPSAFEITYHPLWHHPREIDVDVSSTTFGDEWGISIRGVRPAFTFGAWKR